MSPRDLKSKLLYTPAEVAEIFRHDGDLKWVYRHAAAPTNPDTGKPDTSRGGFLAPHARRFGAQLMFNAAGIDALLQSGDPKPKPNLAGAIREKAWNKRRSASAAQAEQGES